MTYSVAFPTTQQTVNASLNPVFYDILTGFTQQLGTTTVKASLRRTKVKHRGRKVTVSGRLNPVTTYGAKIVLYRAKVGHQLRPVAAHRFAAGKRAYSLTYRFPKGTWKFRLVYQYTGVIAPDATRVFRVRIR